MLRSVWNFFWQPLGRYSLGAIFIVGGFAGIIFWGGFNTFMEYTNTLEFCTSCHEMEAYPYEEYKKSVHYKNASGVRVICSDCHVPKDWTAKLMRKIKASNELYHWALGTIDSKEKYEAKRLELAEHVWASMKASDSRECRNCHTYDAMDFHKQSRRARQKMQEGLKKGKTCIECHKGIAHSLPEDYERDD
ncbi:MAG: Denitrification system component NirT [Rhodospirillaceae bacterium]|jgi:nitrate/TMAO reductase-like tetraheme cytochrome c subunit|nr:Denitrification system component NirT [Rhodospirillaceae bacterium]MBT4589117.1 Denitrification system component NirT [Rhodospirillaceae bacterium]MBT5941697.1 Denitrification system component NirT [Rhodospirillaceae bacterium]MBT7266165.1 Denitrification system component NirT [Rhodospirillaceae bacterium]